jgi:hypothetical protein
MMEVNTKDWVRPLSTIEWNLSKQNLLGTIFCVFGLYRQKISYFGIFF